MHQDADNCLSDGFRTGMTESGQQDVAVVCGSPLVAPRFTEAENPYLFPRNLLDRWPDPTALDESGCVESGCVESKRVENDGDQGAVVDTESVDDLAITDQPRWWLVHTKPRQEKKLAEQLSRLRVSHFLPVTKCKAVTRGRTRISRLPQFPSYLFLRADRDQRLAALETNRIVAAHPVDGHDSLGRQLWDLADLIEKGVSLRVEERLAAGQKVRVKSGLLKDKRGTIMKRGGKTRLFVFVSEMLGGVSLEIEQHLLEPY